MEPAKVRMYQGRFFFVSYTLYLLIKKNLMPHPLDDFLFCPHCGSNTFTEHDAFSKRCGACGFTFYPNAAAATVAVIINSRGELLCVRRDREPARGTLDLPGGFVDPGESITEGLQREVHEELGAEVEAYEFLFSRPNTYLFSGHTVHTSDAFFRCALRDESAVHAADDAAEVMWIAIDQLVPEEFGLASVRQGIIKLKEQLCGK